MTSSPSARVLWAALEPIHAVVYFGPEHAEAMRDVGLRGFWMGYFASRSAPLGPVGPAVVEATFYNFAPPFVRRSLPDAWSFAAPEAVLRERQRAVEATLQRVGSGQEATAERLAELLVPLGEAAPCAGRPLAAANQVAEPPSTVLGRLWWATTVLREHRGDGHVAALVTTGVGPLDAHLLAVAGGGASKATLLATRGWSEEQWESRRQALEARGLLDGERLTATGVELVVEIEERTTIAAESALPRDESVRREIHRLAVEISGRIAGPVVPLDNPIGNPWPPQERGQPVGS